MVGSRVPRLNGSAGRVDPHLQFTTQDERPYDTTTGPTASSDAVHFVAIPLDEVHRVQDDEVVAPEQPRNLRLYHFMCILFIERGYEMTHLGRKYSHTRFWGPISTIPD